MSEASNPGACRRRSRTSKRILRSDVGYIGSAMRRLHADGLPSVRYYPFAELRRAHSFATDPASLRRRETRIVMASLYERWLLPKILRCACSSPPVMKQRIKVVPAAEGRVLELGVGMGLNLRFYDPAKVSEVVGVDPSSELRAIALEAERD